ncbi:MAG: 16S rRNA (cytosine(1402)-N(4))-methyltransferase RsmH [Deferrisomatales bacterium]|nr:16S rRNA (cytosine(1402)-N(4))-methyltransferase RsmH [Deferrisomatales bacterium]
MNQSYHVPVLLEEALEYLRVAPGGTYVDATLGGGGHARALAAKLGPAGRLLAVDQDPEALAAGEGLAAEFPGRVELVHGNFGDLAELLAARGIRRVDGVLADLGVSSRQLDVGERGFSFRRDGPLDMRMDPGHGPSAADLVNRAAEAELTRVLWAYGEEPRARRVARALVAARAERPLRTTAELAAVVERALGRRGAKHPATRTFQALRIAVNGELEMLERLLAALPEVLNPGGRAVLIAYHSLEDRRIKQTIRGWEPHCQCPPRDPVCSCGTPGFARVLTRRAVKPGAAELEANPRARSARLRAVELLAEGSSNRQGGRT